MIISDNIKQFFETVSIMAFSTTDRNGNPNVIAIGLKRIVADDTIWVFDIHFKKTKENLLQNNKVAIAMWKEGMGYQIKGIATYHSEGEIFDEAKEWAQAHSKKKKPIKGIVEIKVAEIFSITPTFEEAGKKII